MAHGINLGMGYDHFRGIFYGYPGSGKTRLAYSAALVPEMGRVLALDASGNPFSASSYPTVPDVIQVDQIEDLNDPYDWIVGGQRNDHPFCKKFGLTPPYGTLILDQLTEIQRKYFEKVLGSSNLPVASVPPKKEWDHFNKVLGAMTRLTRLYFALPIHVIACAQEREADEDKGRPIGPLLEGQSVTEVTSYAYAVGRISGLWAMEPRQRLAFEEMVKKNSAIAPEGINNIIFFKSNGKSVAKDQYGVFGDYIINPTMLKMFNMLQFRGQNVSG